MTRYRCPDPSHGEAVVPLKANNDRVYECALLHKFWRREEGGRVLLAALISGEPYPAVEIGGDEAGGGERRRLNFMVDVPRLSGSLDFNTLQLTPLQWKVVSRVDGRSNLEEIRLLAGLTAVQAEQVIYELEDLKLIEVKRRGGA
jgi:hypothetical protein